MVFNFIHHQLKENFKIHIFLQFSPKKLYKMPPLPTSIIEKEKDLPISRVNLDVVSNPKENFASP